MKYKYLIVDIDKHQTSPTFRHDIPDWIMDDCKAYLTMIVDLESLKRCWGGEWVMVSFNGLLNEEGA